MKLTHTHIGKQYEWTSNRGCASEKYLQKTISYRIFFFSFSICIFSSFFLPFPLCVSPLSLLSNNMMKSESVLLARVTVLQSLLTFSFTLCTIISHIKQQKERKEEEEEKNSEYENNNNNINNNHNDDKIKKKNSVDCVGINSKIQM